MRTTKDEYRDGMLWNGFDYTRQAWVLDGKYVRCGHPESMVCGCYGRKYEGEPSRLEENYGLELEADSPAEANASQDRWRALAPRL